MNGFDIKDYLRNKRKLIDNYLREYFSRTFKPERLYQAVTYSLFAGGKRLRPILAISAFEACGGQAEDVLPQASSIELIHTYSLIHDDLPAMDDDDLRRGKPTNHKVFGEAMAILAGDALLTEAFFMFTEGDRFKAENLKEALRILAEAAGARGMVGGQAEDILSENSEPEPDRLEFIHKHKTGALIAASVTISPVLLGVDTRRRQALNSYGQKIGLAFQIIDDILDIIGEDKRLGKKTGADIEKGKMTYPALYGIEASRKKATALIDEAVKELSIFGSSATPLVEIARYILNRME